MHPYIPIDANAIGIMSLCHNVCCPAIIQVKKVIAAMTVGKDVSMLFPDVVKSMQTDNIELKKLIYLYIINYARSQPTKAIMVVNSFQKDADFPNPLVRALGEWPLFCSLCVRLLAWHCDGD